MEKIDDENQPLLTEEEHKNQVLLEAQSREDFAKAIAEALRARKIP